ncbi:GDP-mannose 4,6-dehydratase [Verrucomicrobiales bacterium]|nr:GDP-mannose 4,6-dehydratase [Verrucomicrobiales bacterium]
MNKKAIITGIAGQDGAFLAANLLDKGYKVLGVDRRRADNSYPHLFDLGIQNQIRFLYFDLIEDSNINYLLKSEQPDEFYNLAAQSFVKASFELPLLTTNVNAMGVLRILDAIKHYSPQTKLYQASTSEMFGKVQEIPQKETTPFYPRSPYGVGKLFAHWMIKNYRESYGIFACSGILFNHESEYRGQEFVTQKIVEKAIKISTDINSPPLELGNLDASRDWGHAKDYVQGMWLMLQNDVPDDFVLATNITTTVREFVNLSFAEVGIHVKWEGTDINEIGLDSDNDRQVVVINKDYYRPAEVDVLLGDYTKAKKELGWEPNIGLQELVSIMIQHAKKRLT